MSLIINNKDLERHIKPRYTRQDIEDIQRLLESKGAFSFPAMQNGLFSAALVAGEKDYTGYTNIWVRDNFHIAHAHYVVGKHQTAVKNIDALMTFFKKYKERFQKIINGQTDAQNPMNRPHIRFDGNKLEELPEKWAHAQNDALGYFLWFYCRMANDKVISPLPEDLEILGLFALYFQAIRYWTDEDSGHWEEVRKVSASSMGIVVAALKVLKKLLTEKIKPQKLTVGNKIITIELLDKLIAAGTKALKKILPSECIQESREKKRRYDAALLFLIYPLETAKNEIADQILQDVIDNLQGEYGIRRYLGDSYWAPDYKTKLSKETRTIDFSDDMSSRDALLPEKGLEAQWCIFDPIVSIIFGKKFQEHRRQEDLQKQIEYLNRSLGQITGSVDQIPPFRCPEMYYLENGDYVPNDHVPLLWAQANLMLALHEMKISLAKSGDH